MTSNGAGGSETRTVGFYFDLVSPYSHLALVSAEGFAAENRIRWDLRPVVYAKLLEAHGLLGPAEVEARRRHFVQDFLRCAAALGVEISGPPAHPFRSLDALRVITAVPSEKDALPLARALSEAAWRDGLDLADRAVLSRVVAGAGFPAEDVLARAGSDEVKSALRAATAEAVERGVFGVPTFLAGEELFWGHDRMEHVAARLDGRLPDPTARAEEILGRPRGVRRDGA